MAGIPMLVSTTQAIAPTKDIPQTEKIQIQKIQDVISLKIAGPTKDELAAKIIENHRKQLKKQKALLEKKRKQIERKKKQKEAVSFQKFARTVTRGNSSHNAERWRSLVAKYPWPVEQAMLVMSRESGGNPRAISATDDHGLFQIHGGYATYGEKIYNPEFNVWLAYNNYYKTRGWTPWYSVQGILW